ncbi:hypothetical protein BDF20DRAFT_470027 [Mycotypha africana]|uniref:uncharacterized protein n=1 Tax=Mycotypha africana TaxID=64632 RepID=UPI0022FFDD3D|nr:uncharacterized protein BDF20DRAFT_470027 [Mycotypha africana]KAI8982414.1 hypothetical protein BDF20DRAFT_470027 [Mycotypha africana]
MKQNIEHQGAMDDEDVDVTERDGHSRILFEHDEVEHFARQLDADPMAIVDSQEEEEEEDGTHTTGYEYYQQLPQDDDGEESGMFQQLASDEEGETEHTEVKDTLSTADNETLIKAASLELDAASRMNPETSDRIKSIMTHIQLSDNAIPEWAKKIPEHAWLPRVKN